MQKSNPDIFSEKDLDDLLNKSFLESHLVKRKYEKITEAIAAHALGVKPVKIYTRKSFITRMIGKISLQVLLIGSVVLAGGIGEIAFLNYSSEEPLKINVSPFVINDLSIETSGNNKYAEGSALKELPKINTALPAVSGQRAEASDNKKYAVQKSISSKSDSKISNRTISKRFAIENTISAQVTPNDRLTNSLIIQKPEPIYFDYQAISLHKEKDSISAGSGTIENKSPKNDSPKKKKIKIRKRSTAKEKNKNKTERDRSGKTYNF